MKKKVSDKTKIRRLKEQQDELLRTLRELNRENAILQTEIKLLRQTTLEPYNRMEQALRSLSQGMSAMSNMVGETRRC